MRGSKAGWIAAGGDGHMLMGSRSRQGRREEALAKVAVESPSLIRLLCQGAEPSITCCFRLSQMHFSGARQSNTDGAGVYLISEH